MWEDVEMDFFRKNFIHLTNFFNYILEHLMCILIILTILILSGILLINLPINNPENIETQQILIFGVSLENWGIWYTAIGLIIGAVWSIYQFSKNKILKQQEKASEIAQDFATNLIEKLGIISDVLLTNKEFKSMISKIKSSQKLHQFTTLEMSEILKDSNCYEKCYRIIHSKRTQKRYNALLNKRYNEFEKNRFESYFPLLIENTLNHLEAICINISSQAAGSQFIYDSLHQSFLNTVEVLSIKISSINHNNIDKYFINVIQVYNMWNEQRTKDIKKFKKTKLKIDKLENKVNKEIFDLLNKKTKTV